MLASKQSVSVQRAPGIRQAYSRPNAVISLHLQRSAHQSGGQASKI
jgi:hypothetical protein